MLSLSRSVVAFYTKYYRSKYFRSKLGLTKE